MKRPFIMAMLTFAVFLIFRHFFGYPSALLVDYGKCPASPFANCAPPRTTWGNIEPWVEILLVLGSIGLFLIGLMRLAMRRKAAK